MCTPLNDVTVTASSSCPVLTLLIYFFHLCTSHGLILIHFLNGTSYFLHHIYKQKKIPENVDVPLTPIL